MTVLEKKYISILGMGKSGRSSAEFFLANGYEVIIYDDNPKNLENLDERLIILNPEDWPFEKLESVIFSPGIPHNLPEPHRAAILARKHEVEIICDIEVLYRYKPEGSRIIAITGTNGKSTTTALIYHILKECGVDAEIGGNYGIAALSLDLETKGKIYVIETSSFQLDLCNSAIFDVSVLLNITPDHLERYVTMDKYGLAKRRIFEGQNENCSSIICIDQPITENIAKWVNKNVKSKKHFFSCDEFNLNNSNYKSLQGEHNKQNIIAALHAVRDVGIKDDTKIFDAIASFKGLKHRANLVLEAKFVKFINDSKATNADATEPALKTFDNIFWLAGGVAKVGGIESLKEFFPKLQKAYFYGKAKDNFASTFKEEGFENFEIIETFEQAVKLAAKEAEEFGNIEKEKACVLLSPACASFDEFKNFEARGEKFEEIVLGLSE